MFQKRLPDPNRPPNNPAFPHLLRKERKFTTPEEMEEKIVSFFFHCENNYEEVMSASGVIKKLRKPLTPTVHALAAWLEISTETLLDYEKDKGYEDFHFIVKMAKQKILAMKTMSLVNNKGATNGLIFDLKNNHGWKEKSEIDSKNEHRIVIDFGDDKHD